MPGRDGTGPMGCGATRGKNLDVCNGNGNGLGYRRSLGKSFVADPTASKTQQQELLQEQKKFLESRLNVINDQLQSL